MKRTFILITTFLASICATHSASAQSEELIRVYRWYSSLDRDYVTVSEDEYQEGQMLNWQWKDKTLLFYAYRNPGPDRVAVYSWYSPNTRDHISVAEDEYSDDRMIKWGYKEKKLQFYALTRRGPNTVPIYRWRINRNYDWVTIPEDVNTDVYLKKGYGHKTFQYFGIPRNVDAPIYNQL